VHCKANPFLGVIQLGFVSAFQITTVRQTNAMMNSAQDTGSSSSAFSALSALDEVKTSVPDATYLEISGALRRLNGEEKKLEPLSLRNAKVIEFIVPALRSFRTSGTLCLHRYACTVWDTPSLHTGGDGDDDGGGSMFVPGRFINFEILRSYAWCSFPATETLVQSEQNNTVRVSEAFILSVRNVVV
jgi:hypothetical protein